MILRFGSADGMDSVAEHFDFPRSTRSPPPAVDRDPREGEGGAAGVQACKCRGRRHGMMWSVIRQPRPVSYIIFKRPGRGRSKWTGRKKVGTALFTNRTIETLDYNSFSNL